MTIAGALEAARARGLERLDAQLLMLRVLGRSQQERAWLIAHDQEELDSDSHGRFDASCSQRLGGEPIAYLVGEKQFHGLTLKVDPRVLVPRPETETLVDWALELLGADPAPRVLDLGTGSGAIALAIKSALPNACVEGLDASDAALAVAAENAAALSLDVSFRQGSWLEGVAAGYDLIVSNPPYVTETDPHLADLRQEPLSALAAGPDGLADIRTIVAGAPAHLVGGGWLLLEHGWDQAAPVRDLLLAAGLANVTSRRDLAGIERCSGGQRLELG